MDIQSVRDSEYEAQLFGFTAEDFKQAFKQLIKEEVSRLTSSMASSFIKKYQQNDPEIELVKDIRTALINSYMFRAEEPINTLKTQLKQLMNIAPHVLLPEDEVQRTQYSAEEEEELDDQLKDLIQRLKRTNAMKVELQQELKMLQDVLPDLNKKVEELEHAVLLQSNEDAALQDLEPVLDEIGSNTRTLLQIQDNIIS